MYCRHDPHRSEIRDASPGKLDLNPVPQSKGGSCRSKSRSCNISEKSGLSHSNRSVVLLQPNVKSLKIATAVNDVNKKLVIGEVVKQFNLGGSCRSGEEVKTSRNIEFIADFRLPEEMRR